jgi:hypothetical protein
MARAKPSFWSRSLEKVKGAFVHAEPEQQPKPRPPKKKPEPTAGAVATKAPTTVAQDAGASPKPEDEKSAGKKIPVQPWYRHRQRW